MKQEYWWVWKWLSHHMVSHNRIWCCSSWGQPWVQTVWTGVHDRTSLPVIIPSRKDPCTVWVFPLDHYYIWNLLCISWLDSSFWLSHDVTSKLPHTPCIDYLSLLTQTWLQTPWLSVLCWWSSGVLFGFCVGSSVRSILKSDTCSRWDSQGPPGLLLDYARHRSW